ncbi:thioredoxin domain-containing protein [Candidatus Uhrbacteria bacterium]|nr:thioredoxin domain-containing protein [Candidatus Uhrbacteria bacterium]
MRKAPIFPILTVMLAVAVLAIHYLSVRMIDTKGSETNPDVGSPTPLEMPTIVFGNPMVGNNSARVTIVEFSDYLCGPCGSLDQTLTRLAGEYPNDVRLVWKDFPNEKSHPGSVEAAMAARCAADQGAFWEYHRAIFSDQTGLNTDGYVQIADSLGLDTEKFRNCQENRLSEPLVRRDLEEALRLRLDATPYIFVNDRRLSGALSYEILKSIVDGEISESLRTENAPSGL